MSKEGFFKCAKEWQKHWQGLPSFNQTDKFQPHQTLMVHFRNPTDRKQFADLVGCKISDRTPAIWYPKHNQRDVSKMCWRSNRDVSPRYPIYVISKGRWESRLTIKVLEKMQVDFYVVIEPQEYDQYAEVVDSEKILTLPFSNLGQGSIPARNWVWQHAVESGAKRHWILDDNLREFYRLQNNMRIPVRCGAPFRVLEDLVDRYENVAMAGLQYKMFAANRLIWPAFSLNTRVYSCILLDNAVYPEGKRWRGRYNEDTDLSLRILKDNYCTILLYAFLADKIATMTMKGGNTDELYVEDGRMKMAKSLQEQHPELVTITHKWGRWQHVVDYSKFKRNMLKLRGGVARHDGIDEYGLYLEDDGEPINAEDIQYESVSDADTMQMSIEQQ